MKAQALWRWIGNRGRIQNKTGTKVGMLLRLPKKFILLSVIAAVAGSFPYTAARNFEVPR